MYISTKMPNYLREKVLFGGSVNKAILTLKKLSTSKNPQRLFVEKDSEEPVIVINEFDSIDIIGPPDSISNLRPVIRGNLVNETPLQRKLRNMQNATQEWNQNFWSEHNKKFVNERKKYIDMHPKTDSGNQLTAEEMSEFYKKFLDEHWHNHVKYNVDWYKKNFTLLFLAIQVYTEKLRQKIL